MRAKKGESTNYLVYDGKRFYKCSNGYYKGSNGVWMHRYVWEIERGEIPMDCDIHHIDGDRSHNTIDNLECVPRPSHHKDHMVTRDMGELHKYMRRAQVAAPKWHGSAEGKAWHSKHYAEVTAKLRENKVTRICEVCGKEFEVDPMCANRTRYCSNGCKTKARYRSGADNETRVCPICGKEFSVNKYSRTRTCSRECGTESQRRTKAEQHRHRA